MKTILVATDFSTVANNAVNYATDLARHLDAKLVLLHVYSSSVAVGIPQLSGVPTRELEERILNVLTTAKNELHSKFGADLDISVACVHGYPTSGIREYAHKCSATLIVIGAQGSNSMIERSLGTVATAIVRDCDCPVIAVGRNEEFHPFEKIVLACDAYEIPSEDTLMPLKKLVAFFNAELIVLNIVQQSGTIEAYKEALMSSTVTDSFKHVKVQVHQEENMDPVTGISEYVDTHDIDLLVMIPGRHGFIERLFIEPTTNRMLFSINSPLLTLPTVKHKKRLNELV